MNKGVFSENVIAVISMVPFGRLITYGDIAALAGRANASRAVGGIAHFGDLNLPWHRLVNRFGGLASGFPGGRMVQAKLLMQEGVDCENFIVCKFKELRWRPEI